jgi:hypothetical protein
MLIVSLIFLAAGTFFSVLTYHLIDGYFLPGYVRTPTLDADGNEAAGLVVNDWWPATLIVAFTAYLAGIWAFKRWANKQ